MGCMSASANPSEPPRPRRRWAVWAASALGLVVLLPVVALGLALLWANTQGGRDSLARLAAAQVPGLTLDGLEGPLPGRLGLARLTMADDQGVWLEVEQVSFRLDLRALLRGTLRVEALEAARLTLHRLPASTPDPEPSPPGPLLPEWPHLPLAVQLDRLQIAEIRVGEAVIGQALALRAEGRARLDPTGLTALLDVASVDAGTTLTLDASLRPGAGRLNARLLLRDQVGGPVGRLLGLPDRAVSVDLTLDGPAEGAALRLDASAGADVAVQLAGTLRAPNLTRLAAEITGRIEAAPLLPAPFAAPFEVVLTAARQPDGGIDLDALRVTHPSAQLTARGRVSPAGALNLAITATLPDSETLAPLLPNWLGWQGVAATAQITGTRDAPHLALDVAPRGLRSDIAPLAALLGATPRLELRATTPDRIERLSLIGAGLQAELRGAVGEVLDVNFTAEASLAEGDVTGALRLAGRATGPRQDPSLSLTAESPRLAGAGQVLEGLRLAAEIATPLSAPRVSVQAGGRLQGLPLNLDVAGGPEDEGWLRLSRAALRFGPAEARAEGRLHPQRRLFEGPLTLDAPDLAPFSALARQPIAGALTLRATGTAPEGIQRGEAVLEVPRLTLPQASVAGLRVTASGDQRLLEMTLRGRIDQLETDFAARLSEAPAGARRLEITRLVATGAGETMRLAAPARLTLGADGGLEVAPLTLNLGRGATLRAEGKFGPERADLRLTLPPVALAGLASLVPDANPSGTLGAEFRITGAAAAPELALTIRGSQLRGGNLRGAPPAELRAEARRDAAGLITARGELTMGAAARLLATLRLPNGPAGPIEGTLDGNADIAVLTTPLLAAGANRLGGRVALALRVNGTVEAPQFGGEARLTGGSYRNPLLGTATTDVAGTLRAEGERLRLDLTGRSGAGRVAVAGTLAPLAAGFPIDLLLTAEGAQPVSMDLLRATLDAELRLAGGLASGATLSGPIRLRRADIRVPERLPPTVRSLGRVTERGTPPGRPARPPPPAIAAAAPLANAPITLAISFAAPRNVFVRGRGLDVEMGGNLEVAGTVAAPEITGELAMRRGDLQVLARRLAFERGRLAFDGGLMPDLDFRATSVSGDTTVAVEVTGPPTSPTIAFTSVPELPQDEVLARLLFDRPAGQLSPIEAAQIAQAIAGATGIGNGTVAGVLERVRETFALDRLSVGGGESASSRTDPDGRRGASLEAGRYVAEGVYVGVRQGTETGSTRVGVRVELTPRIRLEVETGDRKAGERVGVAMEWQWGR